MNPNPNHRKVLKGVGVALRLPLMESLLPRAYAANHTLLSGVKSTERAGYPDGNITVDQRAAELVGHSTRFRSLTFWGDGMSFTRTGVRVPAIEKPSDVLKLLFVDDSEEQKQFNRSSLNSSGSIFDAVLEDACSLNRELGTTDRRKLEEYFSSIRETEKGCVNPLLPTPSWFWDAWGQSLWCF